MLINLRVFHGMDQQPFHGLIKKLLFSKRCKINDSSQNIPQISIVFQNLTQSIERVNDSCLYTKRSFLNFPLAFLPVLLRERNITMYEILQKHLRPTFTTVVPIMARTGEKRSAETIHETIPVSENFPNIPLDLAARKRFKFMIDHLLDRGNTDGKVEKTTVTAGTSRNYDDTKESDELEHVGIGIMDEWSKTSPVPGHSLILRNVTCRLEGRELWNKFYELSTEMIITKSGRLVSSFSYHCYHTKICIRCVSVLAYSNN